MHESTSFASIPPPMAARRSLQRNPPVLHDTTDHMLMVNPNPTRCRQISSRHTSTSSNRGLVGAAQFPSSCSPTIFLSFLFSFFSTHCRVIQVLEWKPETRVRSSTALLSTASVNAGGRRYQEEDEEKCCCISYASEAIT